MTDSPIASAGQRVALYSSEFAADPHASYRRMRETYGSLVPVELSPGVPATLVIGYRAAVRITCTTPITSRPIRAGGSRAFPTSAR
ncbi:hypothetical protein ABIA39_002779 [Nocardia sp. GAS34]|uniref:hypothetical protein n=1 Tax=unclassified Nocardia TaxID=2637762 RepID=UPI003D19557B